MTRSQQRRECILRTIQNSPGIQFRELMRRTGMKNGVLSHHLHKIEKTGVVRVERRTRRIHYYPLEITEMEQKICRSLRRGTPRRILLSLMHDSAGLQFGEVVERAARSPSMVSVSLSQLVADGIVEVSTASRRKRYRVRERQAVDRLIEEYRHGILDAPASRMEEIFSSL